MKTLLTALITFSLATSISANTPPIQEETETLSESSAFDTIVPQNQLTTDAQELASLVTASTEISSTEKPFETLLQESVSNDASMLSTQDLLTTTPASIIILSPEKPTHSASLASQTLTAIFNFLALLLQSTHNQMNTAPSFSQLLEDVFTLITQTSGKKGRDLAIFMNDIKIDCNNTLKRTCEDLSVAADLNDYKRPSKDAEKDAKTQAALCNVATIVTGVANIVQNPHDKVNVGQSVGSILAGIVNIALLASHKPRQQILTDLMESLNVTA